MSMEHNSVIDQEFACEDCGFTSPLSNDTCPNCNGRMVALDAPPKKSSAQKEDGDDLTEETEESFASADDGQALSLERLQEEESRDDHESDNYSDDE